MLRFDNAWYDTWYNQIICGIDSHDAFYNTWYNSTVHGLIHDRKIHGITHCISQQTLIIHCIS